MQTTSAGRVAGRLAFLAACAATVLAPIHALARFATVEGARDLDSPLVRWWAEPAARGLRPMLDWSGPYTVYVAYGRIWFSILIAATVAAFVVRRARTPVGLELWGWRIALTGYVLATLSVVGDYWTPWLDESFMFLGIPGMFIGLIGSSVLGIAWLRRALRPAATGWLLATWPVTLFCLAAVVALGAGLLPMVWAWGLVGRRLEHTAESAGADALSAAH
ncbi:MAG TPA: hypothetical protein VK402_08500 [Blastococcus sp.]|nr:hypothetical protein [Blastococcus sp.]